MKRSVVGVCLVSSLALNLLAGQPNLIRLNVGAFDPSQEAAVAPRKLAATTFSGKKLHLVQFSGPIQPEWVAQLEASGQRIVSYIPDYAYLVYGDATALAGVQSLKAGSSHITYTGTYLDSDKIQPNAKAAIAGQAAIDVYAVQLVRDDEANAATLGIIDSIKLAPIQKLRQTPEYVNVYVRLPADQIEALSTQPDVISISLYKTPKKMDERQDIIVSGQLSGNAPSGPGYLAWLDSMGFTQSQFTASGLAVDVTDSGIDNGTTTPNHFGLYTSGNTNLASRVIYSRLEGTANSGSTKSGCDGHGNLNSHIISGYVSLTNFPHTDKAGYRYGLGVCPFVKVGSSVIFDPADFTSPSYGDLISRAYRDGARISSDSWGADTAGAYDVDAQEYDELVRDAQPSTAAVSSNGNQGIVIVFAAGNAGSAAKTVGSPGTAKNVITVGAAENVQSHAITNGGVDASGNDGCTTPDSEANSANDIASFSSRGPCADGRHKPEICAPGTHVSGGVAQNVRTMAGTGTGLACFTGEGVCGLPGGGTAGSAFNFFPTNQQFYSTSSGTSHSTPAVAGGCALIYQWFLNKGYGAPSPAMVKAVLMNSARYMTGTDANDNLWSDDQGMGMMDLGRAFDGTPRFFKDQLTNQLFTASGQSRVMLATIASNSKPVRVTMAWTDKPGSTTAAGTYNNLNLTVATGGKTYLGNVFNGANSTNSGTADTVNNAESVFLPAGTTGILTITISAANIVGDGVPNYGTTLDQDFALVVYNATEGASNQPPIIASIGNKAGVTNTLLQFSVSASDPTDGDTITLSASNVPAWATFATVTNAAGVTNVFSGTPPDVGLFNVSFYASDKDGSSSETIAINVTDGSCVNSNIMTETFDASASVPAGWTNTLTGNDTSSSHYQSSPNCRSFGTGASLITPAVDYPTQLMFYVDASSGGNGQSATVEYSVGGGSFQSLGTFVASTTGSTKTFPLTSSPNLAGSTGVRFRFNSTFNTWYLDNVKIDGGCLGGSAPAQSAPTLGAIGNKSVTVSNTLQFTVSATPTDGDTVTLTASNLPSGATFNSTNENGTFQWLSAEPAGVYTSTFYAADNDGVSSETITISVGSSGGGGGTLTTNFIETMGTSGSSGESIAAHETANAYDNDSFTMSGTGDMRTTSPSSGYTGSSASFNAMLNSAGEYFQIAGINASGYTGMKLTFGVRKGSTSESGTSLVVEVSTDASSWTAITTGAWLPTGTGTATWFQRTNSIPDAFAVNGLYLRFREGSASTEYRIDDLMLTGTNGAPASETPPVLASIGSKSVLTNGALQFAVAATPTDGDTVTLTASNLPSGATFNSTNENGTFEWLSATPAGVYTTSFYAADNDGVSSETILISVTNTPAAPVVPTNVLATYTFEDASTNYTTAPDLVAANLDAGSVSALTGTPGNYGGNPNNAIGATAWTSNNYFSVTLTPSAGYQVHVEGLKFDDRRSNTGPGTWSIQSSADGFVADLASGASHTTYATNSATFDVPATTNALTLHVSGLAASSGGGTWRMDNLILYGSVNSTTGAPPAPAPILVVTTQPQTVVYEVATIAVGGSSTNLAGEIAWTNALAGAAGSIAAADPWLVASVALEVGTNVINVSGSNSVGTVTNVSVAVVRLVSDTDGDGIPDAWEAQYFTNLTTAGSATDSDGDGMSDRNEFLAGSAPNDSNSLLKATSVSGGAIAGTLVQWQSHSNKSYVISRSENLPTGFTGIGSNIAATPPLNVYTDSVSTNALRAYRIEVQ